ncbi:predicted protein [Phaeodactylum tricornutum CCAP 1055/1]|uniref:Carotenoid oxygenase n=2 Tax=Phaeodactylum tricornutum TaxID=2850 RepID=B7G712_PHATC|nr:predicted protein [Phaeodactylum tricornutum CCAP 1055/1]EEC45689.1 predicted protein [Phaeodactylum tricornutum CCAP 1055/1]|eukprot:XP_002182953.1 predicted protein [Phaeodactylum tricornutum CCAP 1055/1]
MTGLPTLAYCLSSSSSAASTSGTTRGMTQAQSFWDSMESVGSLPDPPPPELLSRIQAKPYRGGFEPATDVDRYEPSITFGALPSDLIGSWAGNGPGRIRIGRRQYGHWFDGDGYVTLLSLDGSRNKVTFGAKYVRTDRFRAQHRRMETLDEIQRRDPPLASAGAWTPRGRGRWYENMAAKPTNPANTATMWLVANDASVTKPPRLLALCEGGQPVEVDPFTLATIGDEASFFGETQPDSFFSAHFSRCLRTGNIYNHGYKLKPGPGVKEINLVRLAPNGTLLDQYSSPMPFDTFVHDSVLDSQSRHLVYFLPPWKVPDASIVQFLLGKSPFGKLYEWDDGDTAYVHIHDAQDLSLSWRIALPSLMSVYHILDVHRDDISPDSDGAFILRVRLAELTPLDRVRQEAQFSDQYRVEEQRLMTTLREYSFELSPQSREGRFVSARDVAPDMASCEFPVANVGFAPVHARRRYCWTNALSQQDTDHNWLDGLQKIDMKTGTVSPVATFGAGNYCGAPIFVPKSDASREDEGYLLAMVYKSGTHQSDAVVLDADTLETLCVMELKHHVPYQFHGDFQPNFVV